MSIANLTTWQDIVARPPDPLECLRLESFGLLLHVLNVRGGQLLIQRASL